LTHKSSHALCSTSQSIILRKELIRNEVVPCIVCRIVEYRKSVILWITDKPPGVIQGDLERWNAMNLRIEGPEHKAGTSDEFPIHAGCSHTRIWPLTLHLLDVSVGEVRD